MRTMVEVDINIRNIQSEDYENLLDKIEQLVLELGGEFQEGIGMEYEEEE